MFDTTGVGYFSAQRGYKPDVDALVKLLHDNRARTVKVTKLVEVEVEKAVAKWEVTVSGMA